MSIYKIVALIAVAYALCGCSKDDLTSLFGDPAENVIRIGGIDTDEMTVSANTRAANDPVPAETKGWLVQPLKNGLDITYGLSTPDDGGNHEDVAILKLEDSDKDNVGDPDYDVENGLAVYSFKYRADRSALVGVNNDAIWYNNLYHYFQGLHVPERIRYNTYVSEVEGTGKAPALTTDQHNAADTGDDAQLGNYTLLSHYLGMPANYRLHATVERIKLPFRHRLARVVAFVLIDPVLGTTLKGYKKDASGNVVTEEDPTTTSIRFCNVKVLQGVKDTPESADANAHHNLTPTWTEARKIIPHFDGERGSYSYKTLQELDGNGDFKFYYKQEDSRIVDEVYPTSPNWNTIHGATPDKDKLHNGYVEVNYGKVPVYDVIVRPTYSTINSVSALDNVMYDEDLTNTTKQALANETNKIDFEIELENGLRYEKRFEFDLNANYQTVVYLRISREHVDYNDAGSDLWIEEKTSDGWYGVNNENGNILSKAGSSWQRAYTSVPNFFTEKEPNTYNNVVYPNGVTDGQFYNADKNGNDNAQYYTATYDAQWIEKFLQAYQGGKHHGDYFILKKSITIDATKIPKDFVFTGHLDGQDNTITLTNCGETVIDVEAYDEDNYKIAVADDYSGTLYEKKSDNYVEYYMPTLYTNIHHAAVPATYYTLAEYNEVHKNDDGFTELTEELFANLSEAQKQKTSPKPAYDEYKEANPTVAEMMSGTYYVKVSAEEYCLYHPTLYANHPIHHDAVTHQSPSYLFAGLNGEYRTNQEDGKTPWEANVHQETNKSTVWVPTVGYRAEVINTNVASTATLFKDGAIITGNVQNCWSKWTGDKGTSEAVPNNTPAIPQYKQQ